MTRRANVERLNRVMPPRRHPCGKLQQPPREVSPTEIRRLRDAAVRGLKDAIWSTELGRLYLEDKISGAMCGAGLRWAREAAKWSSSIGVFPVRSAALERGHAHPADPDSPEGQEQAQRDRQAAERFREAHAVLIDTGSGAERAVVALCERDESPTFVDLLCARAGLRALADHYGLTDGKKASTSDRHVGVSHPPD